MTLDMSVKRGSHGKEHKHGLWGDGISAAWPLLQMPGACWPFLLEVLCERLTCCWHRDKHASANLVEA